MPRTLRRLGVLAVMAALLTTGCTAGAPHARKPSSPTTKASAVSTGTAETTTEPDAGTVTAAKRVRVKRDLTPVGDLVDSGHGIGIYYGLRKRDHQLFLRAIEVSTGKVRWQKRAVVGEQRRLRPAVSDGEVAFVSASSGSDGGSISTTVVEASSGRVLTGPCRFTGKGAFEILVCGTHRFCVSDGPWNAEVPAFGPGARTGVAPAPAGWFYSEGHQVVGLKAGKEAWRVAGTTIWPFTGSPDFGLYPVGITGGGVVHVIEGVRHVPARKASDIVTVGLSADDGHVLWKKVGFDALCATMTPSGDPLGHTIDTACRWTDETKAAADEVPDDGSGVSLVIDSFTDGTSPYDYVGYNRQTGATIWTDDTFALPGFSTRPMSTDGETFTAVSADDREVSRFWSLWVSDGTDSEELPEGSNSWIAEPVDLFGTDEHPSDKLPAQTRLAPVNSGGYEGIPDWPFPDSIGVHVGSLVAVADDEGISTYRASR